ncbi:MAG TPA: type 2 lanthipeptide synthetase LanM family protein [Rhizomicrobium sp.]|nr:type 2 lanthipeptide synthetase LanM family protein [Rhizomicrobium sp.]
MTSETLQPFDGSLGCLTSRDAAMLATQLSSIPDLSEAERSVIHAAAMAALHLQLHRKLTRVLLVELNAARVQGRLDGDTPQARWRDFLEGSSKEEFWTELSDHYPSLLARVARLAQNAVAAAASFARRWAADRDALTALCGGPVGALTGVSFGAGDTHCGGQTVAILSCEGGKVIYKPRPMAVDVELNRFVDDLEHDCRRKLFMRVPAVVDRGGYGWAEFVAHRYADGEDALHHFYKGIGHWLAVMRVLGGVDFHAENLIAHGDSPAIIDCETLFAPRLPPQPSGYGEATDKALLYVSGTVLATGLLPSRGKGLGWRGVDVSALGSLPGQQPVMMVPDVVNAGTDEAKIGLVPVEKPPTQNLPTPQPSLSDYWPDVLSGFQELSDTLRALDSEGVLRKRVARFEDCRVRVILRSTEIYSEVARMLWHPVSLHNEDEARARARDLLGKMAANVAVAPSDPEVIEAEIDDMMAGDVPYFATVAKHGALDGPGGTRWLAPRNLVEESFARWRAADLVVEKSHMRAALVSAYMADGWLPSGAPHRPAINRHGDLDTRRRKQAAVVISKLLSTAIRGGDGSVSWIAPILLPTGWTVQPLSADLYNGIAGITVLAGAYVREMRAGRADPIDGVEDLLASLTRTAKAFGDKHARNTLNGTTLRPQPPGGYLGIGSQIWTRLVLAQWGMGGPKAVKHALQMSQEIPAAAAADDVLDVLRGRAGAIPPLLALYRKTSETELLRMAEMLGDQLCEKATRDGDRAWWVNPRWPNGLGGFAHGVTGIGWALHKLADASGSKHHREIARAAFAFEDSLFDVEEQNWIDLRDIGGPKTNMAWCHGAVGIGLARLDVDPLLKDESTRRSLRLAAAASWKNGFGWNHCTCHGDMGCWEVLDKAIVAGEGPKDLSREDLLLSILTSIEETGPVGGVLKDAAVPGLLPGLGGIAYQLLRAHPQSGLPSVLLLEEPSGATTMVAKADSEPALN